MTLGKTRLTEICLNFVHVFFHLWAVIWAHMHMGPYRPVYDFMLFLYGFYVGIWVLDGLTWFYT